MPFFFRREKDMLVPRRYNPIQGNGERVNTKTNYTKCTVLGDVGCSEKKNEVLFRFHVWSTKLQYAKGEILTDLSLQLPCSKAQTNRNIDADGLGLPCNFYVFPSQNNFS